MHCPYGKLKKNTKKKTSDISKLKPCSLYFEHFVKDTTTEKC